MRFCLALTLALVCLSVVDATHRKNKERKEKNKEKKGREGPRPQTR